MTTKLIWATPEAEKTVMYCARVSNPKNQDSNDSRLLNYCIKHGHWSIFEMAHMCVEIITSRAISAQILRHRSFSFQEFSQRYAEATEFKTYEARRQDLKNRQNSLDDLSPITKQYFEQAQFNIQQHCKKEYEKAISLGIAKECARMLLPMSTETKIYMVGSIRSWIHYFNLRCDKATQLEHRVIALSIRDIFSKEFPIISQSLKYLE